MSTTEREQEPSAAGPSGTDSQASDAQASDSQASDLRPQTSGPAAELPAQSEPDPDRDPGLGSEPDPDPEPDPQDSDADLDDVSTPVTADTPSARPATATDPPTRPHAFLKGATLGLILLIPLTALAVLLLGRLGIGDPEASYTTIIAFVAMFAGLPAMITAGGIGRAAASALVRPARGGPSASMRVAAIYSAITAVGLVLLTVVPLGEVPTEIGRWLWIIAIGGAAGALGGVVLGMWIGYGSRLEHP
ncbi:MAG TPA: hypothetical protein VNO33_21960 [Kofleriaceae bacterium]|nr:hypothetical protein [Kofleriaceae bacterium]